MVFLIGFYIGTFSSQGSPHFVENCTSVSAFRWGGCQHVTITRNFLPQQFIRENCGKSIPNLRYRSSHKKGPKYDMYEQRQRYRHNLKEGTHWMNASKRKHRLKRKGWCQVSTNNRWLAATLQQDDRSLGSHLAQWATQHMFLPRATGAWKTSGWLSQSGNGWVF